MKRRLVLIIVFYLTLFEVAAQTRPLKTFSPKEGLGHSVVYRISQDQKGFLWFSTDNGLTRYDGSYFENFTSKDGLESNFIFGTYESDSSLLVASYGRGIATYRPAQNRFIILAHSRSILYPIDFTKTEEGLFVIDRNKKIYRLTKDSVEYLTFKGVKTGAPQSVFKMIETSSGQTIVAGSSGLARYAGNKIEFIPLEGVPTRSGCYSVVELNDRNLLFASNDGIYFADVIHNRATLFMDGDFHNHSQALFKDRQGNIWISTLNGELWLCSPDLQSRELIKKGIIINQIFQDNSDNIWLATYGEGVVCLPSLHIKNYVLPPGILITDLAIDQNSLKPRILSSNRSPLIIPQPSSTSPDTYHRFYLFNRPLITHLINPGKDDYIAGSQSYVYWQRNDKIDSVPSYAPVSSLYRMNSKDLLIGTRFGLHRVDSSFKQKGVPRGMEQRIIRTSSETSTGAMLIGTDDGLYIESDRTWKRLSIKDGLPNNYINTIYRDVEKDVLWIGTNEGLVTMAADNRITTYNHPLARLRCNSIIIDKNKTVWIATNEGLVNYQQGKFNFYNENDGFLSDIFKLAYEPSANILYATSWNTLSVISLDKLESRVQSESVPGLFFKDIRFDDQSFRDADTVRLAKPNTHASVTFSIPYYHNRKQLLIQYKVRNELWHNMDNHTEAAVFGISYGRSNVLFQVVDFNKRVIASRTLTIYNPVPVYRKVGFVSALLLMMIAAVVLTTRYITSKKSRQKELALLAVQQQVDLEHKALQNMLSPHFMNNAINSIQAFVTRNDQRSTLSYLAKFARLMRANLELLENSSVTLDKELQNLDLYLTFETLRFSGTLSYEIIKEESVDAQLVRLPSLVLQPFVENAIWHGILPRQEKGHLSIQISCHRDSLVIVVEDDGIGIIESEKRKDLNTPSEKPSRGLKIVEKRFILLNKITSGYSVIIKDRSSIDHALSGTYVEIRIPLNP